MDDNKDKEQQASMENKQVVVKSNNKKQALRGREKH
jgi:hypothetical protein